MEAKAPAIQRPGAAESQHLPEPLEMALQTIAMCNQYMRPVVAEDEEEFHIITPDLPVQMLQIKRFIRQTSGGSMTIINPRLQGYDGQATFLHTVRGEDNYRQIRAYGLDVDGTLTGGFYFMTYGAISTYASGSGADGGPLTGSAFFESPTISQAGYALSQLIIYGGESCVSPTTLAGLNGGAGFPIVKLIGGQKCKFYDYHGLPQKMNHLTHIDVAGWGGTYTGPLRPAVWYHGCITETAALDHTPSQSVNAGTGASKHRVSWRDCEMDYGTLIADSDIIV